MNLNNTLQSREINQNISQENYLNNEKKEIKSKIEKVLSQNQISINISDNSIILEKIAFKKAEEEFEKDLKKRNFLIRAFINLYKKHDKINKKQKEFIKNLEKDLFDSDYIFSEERTEKIWEDLRIKTLEEISNDFINWKINEEDFKKLFREEIENNFENKNQNSLWTNALEKLIKYRNFKDFLKEIYQNFDENKINNFISDFENRKILEEKVGFKINKKSLEELYEQLKVDIFIKYLINKDFEINFLRTESKKSAYNLDYSKEIWWEKAKENSIFYKFWKFLEKHPFLSTILTSISLASASFFSPIFSKFLWTFWFWSIASAKTNKNFTENHKKIQEKITFWEISNLEIFEKIKKLKKENENSNFLKKFFNNLEIKKLENNKKIWKEKIILTEKEFFLSNDGKAKIWFLTENWEIIYKYFSKKEFLALNRENLDFEEIEFFVLKENNWNFQRHIIETNILTKKIYSILNNFELNKEEKLNKLKPILEQTFARLDSYEKTWNSFLKSKNKENSENDLNKLYEAINNCFYEFKIEKWDIIQSQNYSHIKTILMEDSKKSHKNFLNARNKEMKISAIFSWSLYFSSSMILSKIIWFFNNSTTEKIIEKTITENKTENILDEKIKENINNIFNEKQNEFLKNLEKDKTFWEKIIEFSENEKIWNQNKNQILEVILETKDNSWTPKLYIEAEKYGFSENFKENSDFSKNIFKKLKFWWYNINQEEIFKIFNSLKQNNWNLEWVSKENQRILSEIMFNFLDEKNKNFNSQISNLFYDEKISKVTEKIEAKEIIKNTEKNIFFKLLENLWIIFFRKNKIKK